MFERKLVKQLEKRLSEKRHFIQIVIGPRQTGKTTAVTQAIKNVKTPNYYISADDTLLASREWLNNEWMQARLLQKQINKDTILVVDEIQKIYDWSSLVKQLWDEDTRNNIPLKVILTGSSALLLQKGLSESLMGRFEVLYSPHWNFKECKEAFRYNLDDFLFFGGYPGAAVLKDEEERWARYIGTSIVEPTISQDVLMMEEVRKPALLKSLFKLGSTYSAQELSYTKIVGQLQELGNTVTVAHYLELLEKANVLCGLQKFSLNKIKVRQSSPRFMVFDTSLMTYSYGASRKRLIETPNMRWRLVESAVGAYLLARGKEEGFDVFWWREREDEVDFVLQKSNKITAIEVKSGRLKRSGGVIQFKKLYPHSLNFTVGSANCGLEDFLLGKFNLFIP
ncbi:MAG: ATP-binding protein [Endomicrobium sp.]|jgi:predicted AAA+ superfamily ATPase|nr:ATP-binding protein [Endomicrobium sp.]